MEVVNKKNYLKTANDPMTRKIRIEPLYEPPAVPLKPSGCRPYLRRKLAEAYPAIVHGLVKGAVRGSLHHIKLVHELMDVTRPRREGKTTAQRVLEQLEQDDGAVREAA